MGAENSSQKKKSNEEVQFLLEQQRIMYEIKCMELLKQQQQRILNEKRLENRILEHKPLSTPSPLYPQLHTVDANALARPSTLRENPFDSTNNNSLISKSRPAQNKTSIDFPPSAPVPSAPVPSAPVSSASTAATVTRVQNQRTQGQSFPPSAPVPSASTAAPVTRVQNQITRGQSAQTRNQSRNDFRMCCVSCDNRFNTKIFQCKTGHSSCADCKFRGAKCGVCSNPITNIRNIDLEKFICDVQSTTNNNITSAGNTEVSIPCPNKDDGCKLRIKQCSMENHMKECPYREMVCPVAYIYSGCTWRGKINHLPSHFVDCHPEQAGGNVDTECSFDVIGNARAVHHVVLGNFNFLVNLKVDCDCKVMYMVVQLIGSRISASKWCYELHVYDKKEPRRKYMYSYACEANDVPADDIFLQSNCATLSLDYVKTFLNDSKLTYKFYIKRDETKPKRRYGRNIAK